MRRAMRDDAPPRNDAIRGRLSAMSDPQVCGYEDAFDGPCVLPVADHPRNSRTKKLIHRSERSERA